MAVERQTPRKRPGTKRKKRSPKQCAAELAIERRRERAMKLRLSGWTVREIAKHIGASVGTIQGDLDAVLERTVDETDRAADRARELSLARLDFATKGIWTDVKDGDLAAVRELVRIEQRRAKLLGTDAADKHEIAGPKGGPIPMSARDSLRQKLDALGTRLQAGAGGGGSEPGGDAGGEPAAG